MNKYLPFIMLLIVGCVPKWTPINIKPNVTRGNVASEAFETYRLNTALNFMKLAQRCADGEFEYVSELVEASKALDSVSKVQRSQPIDAIFRDALGTDKLNKEDAIKVLTKVARDLSPTININITPKDVKPPVVTPPSTAPKPPPKSNNVRRLTSQQLISRCRPCQPYGIIGMSVRDHLIQHGYSIDQLSGLSRKQLYCLHDNTHAGYCTPLIKEVQ